MNELERKETEHLVFYLIRRLPKTTVHGIYSRRHRHLLGKIRWQEKWRQYCLFPEGKTIWNKDCLNDVTNFINKLEGENAKEKA